jgi:hypothetical protein
MAELRLASPERSQASGTLEQIERKYILLSLREAAGVVAGPRGAAARLGMSERPFNPGSKNSASRMRVLHLKLVNFGGISLPPASVWEA